MSMGERPGTMVLDLPHPAVSFIARHARPITRLETSDVRQT